MVQVGAATAVPRVGAHSTRPAATLRIARADLDRLLLGKTSLEGLLDEGAMRIEGDAGSVRAWLGALDTRTVSRPTGGLPALPHRRCRCGQFRDNSPAGVRRGPFRDHAANTTATRPAANGLS